tara:strand:+ start:15046 stop:26178 length:11133 start_codon:yes stop_codon:yes gene_type:complete
MKTDHITRFASLLLVFFFLSNDLVASARALANWKHLQIGTSAKEVLSPKYPSLINAPAVHEDEAEAGESPTKASVAVKPALDKNTLEFPAIEATAHLGMEVNMPLNDPRDDIFNFQLPEDLDFNNWTTAYLTYEVKGLKDGKGLAKSLNSNETFGTRNLEKSDTWHTVLEKISPQDLKGGLNYLRFTMPSTTGISAEVKNVKIRLSALPDNEIQSPRLERIKTTDSDYFKSIPALDEGYAYQLREVEMPALPEGLINITGGAKAYQPSMDVVNSAEFIGFKINMSSLTSQRSLSELQVFYFDYQRKAWQGVEIDSIDTHGEIAFVPNKGQTQYFGALLKSPEMPEASAFAPTMIQDIKAANPAEGMNLMQPPSISRTGEAWISYPLNIPSGRKGMQPNLALTYSSDGGSSMVGYGWNISIPSIAVDTKWGVPTYDDNEQTEQYVFNGQPLIEEGEKRSNRNDYNRSSDGVDNSRQFYLKVNGAFQRITRYGEAPEAYWWEVIDGSGMTTRYGKYNHTYGGAINTSNGVIEKNTSTPGEDYDAQWFVTEIEDKAGNLVTYEYDKITNYDALTNNDPRDNGRAWYIKNIYYTGESNTLGKYKIEFSYKSGARMDAKVGFNYGFKLVDDKILDFIRVVYTKSDNSTNELVKYKFNHTSSLTTQFKEMLISLEEFRNGQSTAFYKHEFEYYDGQLNFGEVDVNNDLVNSDEIISVNNINSSLFSQIGEKVLEHTPGIGNDLSRVFSPSPLGSNSTHAHNVPLSFGLGFTPPFWIGSDKNFTLNLKAGGSLSYSQEKSRFQDVNGDGLSDLIKVENRGSNSKLYYYPLEYTSTGYRFGARRRINEPGIFASRSQSFNTGFEALADILVANVSYGLNWNMSSSFTDKYLIDYNADGILDLVKPGENTGRSYVFFGKLDNNDNLSFSLHSANSYSEILQTSPLPDVEVDVSAEPFMGSEMVMTWEAPATGTIDISGVCTHTAEAQGTVEIAIQKNGTYLLGGFLPVQNGSPVTMATSALSVTKGDKLFFRIRSGEDSYEDLVQWDPQVIYLAPSSMSNYLDGAGNNYGTSSYTDGFLLSGRDGVSFNVAVPFKIDWPSISLSGLSDEVEFRVHIRMTDSDDSTNNVYHTYSHQLPLSGGTLTPTPADFTIPAGDPLNQLSTSSVFTSAYTSWSEARKEATNIEISFEVFSTSNVSWKAIDWRPEVVLSPIDPCSTSDSNEDLPILYPVVDYRTYNEAVLLNAPYIMASFSSPAYRIWPNLPNPTQIAQVLAQTYQNSLSAYLVVKNNSEAIQRLKVVFSSGSPANAKVYTVDGGGVIGSQINGALSDVNSMNFNGASLSSNILHIEWFSNNSLLVDLLENHSSVDLVDLDDQTIVDQRINHSIFNIQKSFIGDHHLHWGQFMWNDLDRLTNDPILPSQLVAPTESMANSNNLSTNTSPPSLSQMQGIFPSSSQPDVKFFPLTAKRGENPTMFRTYIVAATAYNSENPQPLDRYISSSTHSGIYGNEGLISPWLFTQDDLPINPSAPAPSGSDIAVAVPRTTSSFTLGETYAAGANLSGNYPVNIDMAYSEDQLYPSYFNETKTQMMDINGDGFPDLWVGNQTNIHLSDPRGGMNETATNFLGSRKTNSYNAFGATIGAGSVLNEGNKWMVFDQDQSKLAQVLEVANIGASTSFSMGKMHQNIHWSDFNGDGLVDRINEGSSNTDVSFSTGSLLASPITYPFTDVSETTSNTINLGFNITPTSKFASILPDVLAKMVKGIKTKNSSFAVGLGVNRTASFSSGFFMDINGDGLADRIEQVDLVNNEYKVYLNTGISFASQSIRLSVLPGYFNQGNTLGINANASGTFGFPIATTPIGNFKGSVNGAYSYAFSVALTRSSFSDLNGDGKVDLLTTDIDGNLKVYHNRLGKALKLKKVTNPIGGSFVIDYKTEGNKRGYLTAEITSHLSPNDEDVFWDMPMSKWVMASLEIIDPYDLQDANEDLDGVNQQHFSFHYDGGVKSRRERDFIGFSRIEKRHESFTFDVDQNEVKPFIDPRYQTDLNCWNATSGFPYVERYYSEVQFYNALIDDDPDQRKIHQYQKDILTDHFFFLNYNVHKSVDGSDGCVGNIYEIDRQKYLISHKENRYTFYQVETSGVNLGQVSVDNSQDLVVADFSQIDENSSVFPALTATMTYVHPEIDTTQVFYNLGPIPVNLLQTTQYTADYDRYYNVIQYRQGHGSALDNYTETLVKSSTYTKIKEVDANIGVELSNSFTINNPFGYATELVRTRFFVDIPLGETMEITGPDVIIELPSSFELFVNNGQFFIKRITFIAGSWDAVCITDPGEILSNPTNLTITGPITNSFFLPGVKAWALEGPAGFEDDTLFLPMYLLGNGSSGCGVSPNLEVEIDIPVTFRKEEIKTINVFKRELTTTINYDLIADMEYYSPIQVDGLTGFLKKHEVRAGSSASPPVRRTHAINGDGVVNEEWQIDEIQNELVSQTTGNLAITNFSYDSYGQVTSLVGPANHMGQRMTLNYTYDSYLHQNIEAVSNSYGESICNIYSKDGNNLLKQTNDINNHPMAYLYDDNNRVVSIFGPNEIYNSVSPPAIHFEYYPEGIETGPNAPFERTIPVAITYHNINSGSGYVTPTGNINCNSLVDLESRELLYPMFAPLRTATFLNGLGQVIQVKKDVSWSDAGIFARNVEVSGITKKNLYGWTIAERLSFLDLAPGESPLTDMGELILENTIETSKIHYDYLGRVDETKVLSESSTNDPHVATGYNYFWDTNLELFSHETISPSPIDQNSRVFLDALGRQIEMWQGNATDGWETTSFNYDPLGQMLDYTSPANETSGYTYDEFGRVTEEVHSDRGATVSSYDLAGNVIQITNAASESIDMTYNYNRLIEKEYSRTGAANNVVFTYGSLGDGKNGAGRVVRIEQGTDFIVQDFNYDFLGNLIEEKKNIRITQAGPQEFITSFRYDTWGRILDMTYPDNEVVTYGYNQTGDLITMEGERPGYMAHDILNSALYDGYGNMSSYEYGNQAKTNLTYHNKTRRLTNSEVQLSINGASQTMLDKSFQYDDIGNIEEITNNATPITTASGAPIGGAYKLEGISYNHLGQLEQARLKYGSTSSGLGSLSIDQTISTNFFSAGRLASKTTIDNISGAAAISDLDYSYNPSKRHQITAVSDQINNITKDHNYTYNAMGSVAEETYTEVDAGKTTVSQKTSYCWTEDQKLAGVLIEDLQTETSSAHHYLYDHTGNRIMKSNIYSGLVNVNSNSTLSLPMDPPTVYVNSYFIATHYLETVLASKHYYMGAQRIATNLISNPFDHDNPDLELIQAPNEEDIGYTAIGTGAPQDLMATLDCLYGEPLRYTTDYLYLQSIGLEMEFVDCNATLGEPNDEGGGGTDPLEGQSLCQCEQSTYFAGLNGANCDEIEVMYFYHPDYLGSVEFITDMRGEPYQFFLNTPWGENLENQYAKNYTSFSSRFRFNGKEWDEETGNYYYGARYYDPKISVWLSVDPLVGNNPNLTPYNFVANNPIIFIDPTGLDHEYSVDTKGKVTKEKHVKGSTEDHLHTKENWDKGKKDAGITVKDQELLPQLSTKEPNTEFTDRRYVTQDLKGHVANTSNSKEAEKVFKFSADNSDIEWSLQDYTDGTSAVGKSYEGSSTVTGGMNPENKNKVVSRDIHSHGGTNPKVDYVPSGRDSQRAKNYIIKNPKAKVYLYMPKNPNSNARILDLGKNRWVKNW